MNMILRDIVLYAKNNTTGSSSQSRYCKEISDFSLEIKCCNLKHGKLSFIMIMLNTLPVQMK